MYYTLTQLHEPDRKDTKYLTPQTISHSQKKKLTLCIPAKATILRLPLMLFSDALQHSGSISNCCWSFYRKINFFFYLLLPILKQRLQKRPTILWNCFWTSSVWRSWRSFLSSSVVQEQVRMCDSTIAFVTRPTMHTRFKPFYSRTNWAGWSQCHSDQSSSPSREQTSNLPSIHLLHARCLSCRILKAVNT